ncbi:MAG: hypothetical protein K9J51_05100 [Desulfotignum sp.]|nr:hypothetical protein [Desulfotignum sp.]
MKNQLLPYQILFLILLVYLVAVPGTSFSQTGSQPGHIAWQAEEGTHVVIFYQDTRDLARFNSKISSPGETASDQSAHTAAQKVDALFEKARDILGMHGFVNQIKIRVYKNKEQLDKAYYDIYQSRSDSRAWYTHTKLTIYVQLHDLHDGMLAHELAHAVIDHYLMVPPPARTAEILARYVDTHLYDKDQPPTAGLARPDVSAQGFSTP